MTVTTERILGVSGEEREPTPRELATPPSPRSSSPDAQPSQTIPVLKLGSVSPCEIELFTTSELGDNTYLIRAGQEAVIVDPQRDAWRYLKAVQALGIGVRHVLETHVHNDYISGALEVHATTGAQIIGPSLGRYAFPHRGVVEGDVVDLERFRLVALETRGHTPEHMSYALFEDGISDPMAVFTGGSLMVGSAGRTDLIDGLTEELTRAQFRSLQRLASLPGNVAVLPTHGAGSFCAAAGPSRASTSTIEVERRLVAREGVNEALERFEKGGQDHGQ